MVPHCSFNLHLYSMDIDNNVVKVVGGAWWRGIKGGKMDICNSVDNKRIIK